MIQAAGVAIDENKKQQKSLFVHNLQDVLLQTVFGPLTIHEK